MHALPLQAARPPAILVAPIGPYPAPFAELIWALHRKRHLAVVEAWAIVDRRSLEYLREDVLDSGRALDQLRSALGHGILDHHDLHVSVLREESDALGVAACRDALWTAAKDAIASAGDRPVVFGLTHGSNRMSCALVAAVFQILGREQDLLLDVRVDDPRVEGDVPFFFPEQDQREIRHGHSVIDARRVDVSLVELDLPRLAGLVDGRVATSFESVRHVARSRSDSKPPQVVVDLVAGSVTIAGSEVDLSVAERFWYGYLASRRGETTDGWVLAGQGGHADFLAFLERTGARRWAASIRTKPLLVLLDGEFVHDEDLRNLRGKTVQRLKRWCADHHPELERIVIPESDGNGRQRIPLAPHRIRVVE
jgi:CRISPR-associated protein (TIGR02584 family)